ncbi:hypothetical protein [Phyllobacterium salinisoli]|uniref:hypothetical protein n=1 Tax=Phyllobacterium salinisoli TaxID=1899321 RepID=UPI0011C077D2|nr:hypothetical protein [Phyllobacterium salinisoli]
MSSGKKSHLRVGPAVWMFPARNIPCRLAIWMPFRPNLKTRIHFYLADAVFRESAREFTKQGRSPGLDGRADLCDRKQAGGALSRQSTVTLDAIQAHIKRGISDGQLKPGATLVPSRASSMP